MSKDLWKCCDISTFTKSEDLFHDCDTASLFSHSALSLLSLDIFGNIKVRLFSIKTILQFDAVTSSSVMQPNTSVLPPSSSADHHVQGAAACPSMHWETDRLISSWAPRPVSALWEEPQTIKSTVKSTESPADSLLYIPAALRSLTLVFGGDYATSSADSRTLLSMWTNWGST